MKKSLKIFIINLDRAEERRNFFIKHFKKLKINYEIFKAHDGKSLTKKQLSKYSSNLSFKLENRAMALDEIATALSFLSVYKAIVENNIAEAIIFEDDVIINPQLIKVIKKIPKNVELVNFKTDAKQKQLKLISRGIYLTQFLEIPNRACAMYLKLSAAKKLLKHGYPIRQPSDGLTGRMTFSGKIRGFGMYPEFVKLRSIESSVKGRGSYFLSNKYIYKIKNYFFSFLNLN